jgi:hypothetical protein
MAAATNGAVGWGRTVNPAASIKTEVSMLKSTWDSPNDINDVGSGGWLLLNTCL